MTVYFFLSGYLITTLLCMKHERTGRISFRVFYLRRVLRISPPFWLVLALACLLHPAVLLSVTAWAHAAVIQAMLALGLTLALAFVVYVAVEKLALRLRRRLSRVLAPAAPARPAAAARVWVAPLAAPAMPVER